LELIDFLKKDLVSIGDVNSVYSPTDKIVVENNDIIPKDIQKVRTIYQNLPESSKNGIYSSDYSMALVHVTTDVSSDKQEELVKEINLRLKEAPIPPGIQVITTGSPAIGELMGRLMAESQAITGIAALLAIFTILYLYFKSFVKSVLPLIPVGCAIIWAAGSMAIFGIPMDMATSIMGSLLLGLGIDYGVHVYHRYEEELKKGSSLNEAIETTVITTGSAVVTTTATTVAGFAALTIAPLPMMSNMGKVCALGIFFCMAAVISILPSLIIIEERHLRPTIKKLKMQLKGDSNE
jgi:predicted RND superfamily exporter protein